jgi:hypothetical protein
LRLPGRLVRRAPFRQVVRWRLRCRRLGRRRFGRCRLGCSRLRHRALPEGPSLLGRGLAWRLAPGQFPAGLRQGLSWLCLAWLALVRHAVVS